MKKRHASLGKVPIPEEEQREWYALTPAVRWPLKSSRRLSTPELRERVQARVG